MEHALSVSRAQDVRTAVSEAHIYIPFYTIFTALCTLWEEWREGNKGDPELS